MKRLWRSASVGFFIVSILSVFSIIPNPSAAQAANTTARVIGAHLRQKGIPNFGQVAPNLYRGAQPTTEGLTALKGRDVEIVVDLRGGPSKSEEETAKKLGMKYVSIPSHCPFPKDEPFAKFLKVIEENPGKKVFVHCRLGEDRTGMAVAAYRIAEEGWPANEAMKEMKEFGFNAVHRAICPRLADYEAEFPRRLRQNSAFRDLRARMKADAN